MLCSVVYIAITTCFGISHFFILLSGFCKSDAALPPGAEDEIVLIEHLPGRRVHLQDFFWTGAEDAPSWVDPNQLLTLYETKTIHHTATVYLPEGGHEGPEHSSHSDTDSSPGPYTPGCTSCIDSTPTLPVVDQDIGILIGDDPGPRYWLLTVLRGASGVPPKVELRLARLYRTAFRRQQEHHLGLLSDRTRRASQNNSSLQIQSLDISNTTKHKVETFNETLDSTAVHRNNNVKNKERLPVKRMRLVKMKSKRTLPFIDSSVYHLDPIDTKSDTDEPINHLKNLKNLSDHAFNDQNFNLLFGKALTSNENEESLKWNPIFPIPLNETEQYFLENDNHSDFLNIAAKLQMAYDSKSIGLVQVRMQNTSVTNDSDTRLIYSVHLGGKPVPAEIAAKDMALLSPQEVALELGTPVLIQSEPYLKASLPLALSRKRDVYLLVGAAASAILLLAIVIVIAVIIAKRKMIRSAVSAPPMQSILKKDREYSPTMFGHDNTAYTSENELRTDGSNQRRTPGSHSRTPVTPCSPDTLDEEINNLSSMDEEDDDEDCRRKSTIPWNEHENPDVTRRTRPRRKRITRVKAIDHPRTPDSMDSIADRLETLETMENGFTRGDEAPASPHSYLSMPSCKQFPSMKSVEPLSRVLEPVMVKHLDIELDSPELNKKDYLTNEMVDNYLKRANSATKDPGVVGPIVWDLRRKRVVEDTTTAETDLDPPRMPHGAVGRARRRLHELLEDSFSLFGSRETKPREDQSGQQTFISEDSFEHLTILSETRGKSAHVSPVATPTQEIKTRPRTSVPRTEMEELIQETGNMGPHPRGAWGSRPLSAGPFHRPILPEVNTVRVLADPQLPPEDPAVPLIDAIKKELTKFSAE